MGKQSSVSEMPQAGAVVSHGVCRARHIVVERQVAVTALVEGLGLKQVGGGAGGGGGSLAVPEDVGSVVGASPDGHLTNVKGGGNDIVMGDVPTQFEIAVGDGSRRVGEEGQVTADGSWEAVTPETSMGSLVCREEEDPAHAGAGCIACPKHRGDGGGDYFREASRAGGEVPGKAAEVGERVMDGRREAHTRAVQFFVAESFLEEGEEASGAWDSQGHGAEFSQNLVPVLGGEVSGGGRDSQDGVEAVNAVGRELDGPSDRVDRPAQHDFPGGPSGVTFLQFLDRGGFLAVGPISGGEGPEDAVEGVQEGSLGPEAVPATPLG